MQISSCVTYRRSGNIAIGNLHLFLPTIVKLVQNDADKRLLALHALKEVGFHVRQLLIFIEITANRSLATVCLRSLKVLRRQFGFRSFKIQRIQRRQQGMLQRLV